MQYYLFIEMGGELYKKVELTESSYTIGRSPSCKIQIANKHVSKIHAYLVRIGNDYYINDGSPPPDSVPSTPGTRILVPNSNPPVWQKKTGAQLKNGDRVCLGVVTLRYITVELEATEEPNSDSQSTFF